MKNEILFAALLAFSCAKPNAPAAPATAPATQSQAEVNGPRVIFPDGFVVHVELATNDETRAQGLMYRDRLRPGAGMLFLFTSDGDYPFWMKNTLIPLDMIWIDQQKKVAHVKVNVPPCKADPCPSYDPQATARYVLEVAGGVSKEHGLKAGDVLRFEEVDGVVAR
ncbi:MAG TPA: DUF192 domain-containing protein [Thermoanaerobaculia bacterium]|nr:DUF192 domain-containing protein [Thermoanaerobaculia bacterium]